MAAAAGGRGARGEASGRKSLRGGGGRSAGEGERNRDTTRWPHREETGRRMMTAGGRTTAVAERIRQVHNKVRSDRDWGEPCKRGGQEDSGNASDREACQ